MLNIVRALGLVVALVLMLVVGGCGGGDNNNNNNAKPAAGKPAAQEQPLAGKGVSRAADLVGVWMRVTEGELLGLEFLKNDQVILTVARGPQPASMTMSYTLLDGGRLSVVSGGGATTVYRTTRSKDLLELIAESAGPQAKPQRFRKLGSGKSLADGLREQAAALEAERAERIRGVVALLRSKGLVIGPGEGSDGGWLIALGIDGLVPDRGEGFGGMLVLDPSVGKADVLRPITVHPFRGSLSAADELTSRVRMRIEIAGAHEPASERDVSGVADLIVDGPPSKPSISGTVRMAGRWQGTREAALAADAKRHASAAAALESQRQAMRAALAQVTDVLGGRAVLRGEKTSIAGGAPEPVMVTIERTGELMYTANLTVGTRRDQQAQGAVGLVLGRGALYINTPWGEQWRVQVEKGGGFDGLWRPSQRHDFVGHGSVKLAVEQMLTVEQVEAERAAIAKFLSEDLRTVRRFVGTVEVVRSDKTELWPVTLELRVGADGSAEGQLWSLPHRGGARLAGTAGGGTITLKATGYTDGSRQDRSLLQQMLNLRLAGVDPRPTLRGDVRIGSRGGAATLVLAEEEPGTAEGAALLESLRGGVWRVTNQHISRRPEPTYIALDPQLDGGEVTGVIVGHDIMGRRPSPLPPGLVRISAVQERGHALVKVILDGSPDPAQREDGKRFEYTATVRRGEDGVTVFAWDAPALGDVIWLRLDPTPAGETPQVSDEQRIRIAAQRMGAVAKPPTSPAVGDTVLLILQPTERDQRVGQIFYADGRYCVGNSIPTAALHAGALGVDEIGVVRLRYREPLTAPTEPVERNGVKSQKATFRPGNAVPTFTVERVGVED